MKKILVPTDFSDCAYAATMVALDIAKRAKAEICFLHLHIAPVEGSHMAMHGGTSAHSKHHSQQGHAKNEMDKLVHLAENLGINAKPVLVLDNGQEKMEAYINSFNVDFMVIGSHGASGLKEVFIGSNAQRIVRQSTVPVLVVKNKIKTFEPKNIVFASSFEEEVGRAVELIADFAVLWDAKLHLLYVNMPFNFKETDQAKANLNRFAHKRPDASINIYDAFNEERGIQKFAHEIGADLIVMTTHGRTGFMKMISPSIAESLVNHEEVPILIINTRFQTDVKE